MAFAVTLPIRFGDCDAAGIGYYPRLLALVDAAIEDWTAATIGIDRATLHGKQRRGLPTITLATHFTTACRMGERLTIGVRLKRVGNSSIDLETRAEVDGVRRFTVALVQALIDTSTGRSVPWPAAWRARLLAAMEPDLTTEAGPAGNL